MTLATVPITFDKKGGELFNYTYRKETMTKDDFIKSKILTAFKNYLITRNLLISGDESEVTWEVFAEFYKAKNGTTLTIWEFFVEEWDIPLEEADFMADFIYEYFEGKNKTQNNEKSILNSYYAEKITTLALLMAYSYQSQPKMFEDIYQELKKVVNKLEQS